MKNFLITATAVGVLYLIYKSMQKKKSCCDECDSAKMVSTKISDDMKPFDLKRPKDLIPMDISKQFDADAGATISKNRMRYKFV